MQNSEAGGKCGSAKPSKFCAKRDNIKVGKEKSPHQPCVSTHTCSPKSSVS